MPASLKQIKYVWLALPLLLIGCGESASSSPEESARIFTESIIQKDWDTTCDLLDTESRQAMGDDCSQEAEKIYGLVGQLYKEARPELIYREKRYTVVRSGAVPERIYLRWEEGAWRVMLDPPLYLRQIQ